MFFNDLFIGMAHPYTLRCAGPEETALLQMCCTNNNGMTTSSFSAYGNILLYTNKLKPHEAYCKTKLFFSFA